MIGGGEEGVWSRWRSPGGRRTWGSRRAPRPLCKTYSCFLCYCVLSFYFYFLLLVFCTIKVSSVVELVLSMHTSYALIYRNIQLHMSTVKSIQYLSCKKIRVLMYDFFFRGADFTA